MDDEDADRGVVSLLEERTKRKGGSDRLSKAGLLGQLLRHDLFRAAIFGRPGKLRFNELTELTELDGVPLRVEGDALFGYRERLSAEATLKFGGPLDVGAQTFFDGIGCVARESSFHPVAEWVRAQVWDGDDRLTGALPACFGVAAGTIQAQFIRLTMRALVARATRPGCQLDTVLVLVGSQGMRKSRALRALGGEWFADPYLDFDNKDCWAEVHRHWLLELGELSSIRKARDLEAVKAFVTRSTDNYRDPYGRVSSTRPRRSVFIGTTNNQEFLSDPTGHRRWWVVEVGDHAIDLEWLSANRSQVFAQALVEVDGGAQWWLNSEEEKAHAKAVEKHVESDPWEEPLQAWLLEHKTKGLFGCKLTEILTEVTGKPTHQAHSGDMRRFATLMRLSGAKRSKDTSVRTWFW